MNDTYVKSHWSELKSKVKARWNKLTDEDINAADGRVDQVCNKIRDRYGISDADARRQFEQFTEGLENQSDASSGTQGSGTQGGQGRQQVPAGRAGESSSGQGSTGHGSSGQMGTGQGGTGQGGGQGGRGGGAGQGGYSGTTKPTERDRSEGAG